MTDTATEQWTSLEKILLTSSNLSWSNQELVYLKKSFIEIERMWQNALSEVEEPRFILLGEAPLYGKSGSYIYSENTPPTSFIRPSDFPDFDPKKQGNKKETLLELMRNSGIIVIDLFPYALNETDTTTLNYQAIQNNPYYSDLIDKTFTSFTKNKFEMVRSKNPNVSVLVRYKRIMKHITPLLEEMGFQSGTNASQHTCIGSTNMGIDKDYFCEILSKSNYSSGLKHEAAETSAKPAANSAADVASDVVSSAIVQRWLKTSNIDGTIDSDGDLYVSMEANANVISEKPTRLFIDGKQKLSSGTKSETSSFSSELTTNETNWLRSDFLKGVGTDSKQFAYELRCDVHMCAETMVLPLNLKKGEVSEVPIKSGQIEISDLKFTPDDGDFLAEGTINGPNGFIYAAEVFTEKPEEGHVPSANKTPEDESSAGIYEYLWDVKEGDTVYIVLSTFEKLDRSICCEFTGEAQVEERISCDDDADGDDFDEPEVEGVETSEGDIGLFEFQIKRGLVNEDEIEDEDVQKLFDELKQLCETKNSEEASKLLLSNLAFEFGPDELDDDPERFFANTDYIEFECSNKNTSVRVGYDDCLIVTIVVQFEIPLKAGVSSAELSEYIPDSGAWASASASPGWAYSESDGDNVRFIGLKD